jgi:hypothetical protein
VSKKAKTVKKEAMFAEGTRVEGKFYVDAETSGGEGSGGEQPEQLVEYYPGTIVSMAATCCYVLLHTILGLL